MKFESHSLLSTAASPTHHALATPITIAAGDGIGPEIMAATLRILKAAGARIAPEEITVGEKLFFQGEHAGIDQSAWASLSRTKVLLKGPVSTPSGGGYKSLNVTLRKTLGLYANVRPCISYAPFVQSLHPKMDVVIVRENEEDLYAGIEHRQSDQVFQCLKLITRPGCEKIVRYAFEYAVAHGRKKVTCMVKDNIMKMTDGLFSQVFEEIGAEYPQIQRERYIIDIGAARLVTRPEQFDVIVTLNLYGDILSDIAAEMAGSVGLAGSANIGEQVAMFEAIHGSAPDLAGQGIANPSGLLHSAIMMLVHIGQFEVASKIHNAWLRALEDGCRTADLKNQNQSAALSTKAFTDAVIARLGQLPQQLAVVAYQAQPQKQMSRVTQATVRKPAVKQLVGVDMFLHCADIAPEILADKLLPHQGGTLKLQMITNRGVKVWPEGHAETFCTDHWRCRFVATAENGHIKHVDIVVLMGRLTGAGLDVMKTENLFTFDGERGFALGQGQ